MRGVQGIRGAGDVSHVGRWPLTPAQRNMWIASRLAEVPAAFHIPLAWLLVGDVDPARLNRALCFIALQHGALRTRFHEECGAPWQSVEDEVAITLECLTAENDDELAQLQDEYAQRPFNLDRGLPWRAALVRLDLCRHALFITLHHVIADGWSVGLLVRDLAVAYRVVADDLGAVAPSESYADYLSWSSFVESGSSVTGVDQSGISESVLNSDWCLPTDRSRQIDGARRGRWQSFDLGEAGTEALHRLVQATGATPFAVLGAVICALLHRYGGQADVAIGYPVANRSDPRVRNIVGCLIKTQRLGAVLTARTAFCQVVDQVKQSLAHGRRGGTPISHPGHPAPTRVILNQNVHYEPELELHGLTVVPLPRVCAGVQSDLSWVLYGGKHCVRGRVEYDASLFDDETICRIQGHLQTLMLAAAAAPTTSVGMLPMMPAHELRRIMESAHGPDLRTGTPGRAHEWVDERAELAPHSVAVTCAGETLSYRQLKARSASVAAQLVREVPRGEQVVAVYLERSTDCVVVMLAALKAGATYLPLDIEHPKDRTLWMLEDSKAAVVVTQRSLVPRLVGFPVRLLVLDEGLHPEGNVAAAQVAVKTPPLHVAYCIYTSGSTGRPKGVVVPHVALAAHIQACVDRFALLPTDRVLQFASFSFDVSIEQSLAALAAGATLVLRGPDRWTPGEVVEAIARSAITVADIPPAYAYRLDETDLRRLAEGGLRLLLVGGEAVQRHAPLASTSAPSVLNAYGPTECTVTCSVADVAAAGGGRGPYIPIGHPMPGSRLHVLDAHLQPVPEGVVGTLYVGGDRLARGYLRRPGLTASRFVPDPFGPPGARLYNSGDLVRRLAGGQLEFVGRADDQVKVRGHRIELGEVEAALQGHSAVRVGVVTIWDDGAAGRRLVAHVEPMAGCAVSTDELRKHMASSLPSYMVPEAWQIHERLPLNTSGKIDRRALAVMRPDPGGSPSNGMTDGDVGRDEPVLRSVLALLGGLLPGAEIGREDDLFAKGFHSMLLVRFIAGLRDTFGVEIKAREIYRLACADQIAAEIHRKLGQRDGR